MAHHRPRARSFPRGMAASTDGKGWPAGHLLKPFQLDQHSVVITAEALGLVAAGVEPLHPQALSPRRAAPNRINYQPRFIYF
ncbi:unnamed protein product [Arctogadus glacialis]